VREHAEFLAGFAEEEDDAGVGDKGGRDADRDVGEGGWGAEGKGEGD
jgi:hypothetical protein